MDITFIEFQFKRDSKAILQLKARKKRYVFMFCLLVKNNEVLLEICSILIFVFQTFLLILKNI